MRTVAFVFVAVGPLMQRRRMSESLLVFLPFLAFPLMVGLAIAWGVKSSRRAEVLLAEVARRQGLTLHMPPPVWGIFPSPPTATGSVRGKRVKLHTYSTGSGKSRTHWAALDVTPGRCGDFTFRIGGQGFGSRLREIFGAREIKVGNQSFDAAFFLETNRPDFFRAALLPEIQERITAAWRQAGRQANIELRDGRVRYAEVGHFSKADVVAKFEAVLPLLGDLADVAEVEAGIRAS